MTSRFGKTYSRKAGEGTSSKFDEVLSTKRGTLSTKWGATTYKAKVGSKRAGGAKNDAVLEVCKRPRPPDDGLEDPFGFDSDEESKPVCSRNGGGKPSPAKPAAAPPPRADRSSAGPDSGSRSSFQEVSWLPSERSQERPKEDPNRFFNNNNSSSSIGRQQSSWSSPETQHSYSWYQNASESDSKPLAQTTTLKTGSKAESSYESWDSIVGLRPPSPSQEPRNPAPTLSWASAGSCDRDQVRLEKRPPSPPCLQSDDPVGDSDFLMESSDYTRTSSSSLVRSTNCRTYRRPNKQGAGRAPDSTSSAFDFDLPKSTSEPGGDGRGRGRTKDFTVLRPSSVSACNITIPGRVVEEFGEAAPFGGSSGGAKSGNTSEQGGTGWNRKKTEPQHNRFRQTETPKGGRRDLFGFDETDVANSSDPASRYKVKYFGFDDTSDSDGVDEVRAKERRGRSRKAKMAAPEEEEEELSMEDTEEPPDPFERLEARAAPENKKNSERRETDTRDDVLDFSEDGLRVVAGALQRPAPRTSAAPCDKNPADSFRRIFSAQKKSPTKAVYNARHWTMDSEEEPPPAFFTRTHNPAVSLPVATASSKELSEAQKDDALFKAPPPPPRVTKCVTIPEDPEDDGVTKLKCRKEHKELYTVVQHVKHFNDVVEFGENQEFTDDFEYLATGLKSGQPLNTRCLSVISLATRCAMPSFRMHLRARGKVAQVFKTLNDAPQHPNLALCTASLMYILSRDRLNMDLDRSCLDLMIRLLELDQDQSGGAVASGSDSGSQLSAREVAKMKERIRKLCDTVHNKHLDLQNITTGHLAMETLLSLTSKRAGDWFKEELRLLGGLDHIIDKVKECVKNLKLEDEEKLVSALWGAERCLRVLESVTVHNPENQSYLIAYKDSSLIVSSAKALISCEQLIQTYSSEVAEGGLVGKAVEGCMRVVIGVLLNLTHDNEWGSTKTGEQDHLIHTALNCVLRVPQFLPQVQRFDIRVLGLGLLINLVEYSARNTYFLMEMKVEAGEGPCEATVMVDPQNQDPQHQQPVFSSSEPMSAIASLVQLFLQRERAAVLAEAQTDDLIKEVPKAAQDQSGEWQETGGEIQWVAKDNQATEEVQKKKEEEEDEELDLNKALQHAGKHMEDSIVASYTALLLGSLCQASPMNIRTVRENLPKGDFSIMTEMLKKFLNFMNLTCDIGSTAQKSVSKIIDYLEDC